MEQFKRDAVLAEMSVEDRNAYLEEVAGEARAFARFQDRGLDEMYDQGAGVDEDARMDSYEEQFGWGR